MKDVTPTDVVCEVQNKARLEGLLTIWHIERVPYGPISNKQNELPLLTDEDTKAIRELAAEFEIDFISLSHSREAEDIDDARDFMKSVGSPSTKIIAKVETKYALTRFKDILNKADGLMISRANLGLDVPAEKIALIQKNMISWCNLLGKPCIVTRVVDTMIHSPRPTRAEATDCANIILDGADGYVLGAETLRGKFPVETVTTVLDIGRMAEQQFDHNRHYDYLMDVSKHVHVSVVFEKCDLCSGSDRESTATGTAVRLDEPIGIGGIGCETCWSSIHAVLCRFLQRCPGHRDSGRARRE